MLLCLRQFQKHKYCSNLSFPFKIMKRPSHEGHSFTPPSSQCEFCERCLKNHPNSDLCSACQSCQWNNICINTSILLHPFAWRATDQEKVSRATLCQKLTNTVSVPHSSHINRLITFNATGVRECWERFGRSDWTAAGSDLPSESKSAQLLHQEVQEALLNTFLFLIEFLNVASVCSLFTDKHTEYFIHVYTHRCAFLDSIWDVAASAKESSYRLPSNSMFRLEPLLTI